jgi:hypothetical protein
MTVFWDVMPYSLVETGQHFRGTYCLHHQDALLAKDVRTSGKSVNLYQTTHSNISKAVFIFSGMAA